MEKLKRNLSVKALRQRSVSRDLDHIAPPLSGGEERDELLRAASAGPLGTVKSLLKRGHDCNIQDLNGWTPLHCAAMHRQLHICRYLLGLSSIDASKLTKEDASVFHYLVRMKELSPHDEKLFLQVMDMLKKKGCDVNHPNKHKETPLHSACMCGNEPAVRFLLHNGADTDLTTTMGETALHYAIRVHHLAIVKHLLEHGADPTIKSAAGTPKDVTVDYNRMDILEVLTQYIQKHQKQKKRAVSSTALPRNLKKESLLSDLIDTSDHVPVNQMRPKTARRELGEREGGEREGRAKEAERGGAGAGGGGGALSRAVSFGGDDKYKKIERSSGEREDLEDRYSAKSARFSSASCSSSGVASTSSSVGPTSSFSPPPLSSSLSSGAAGSSRPQSHMSFSARNVSKEKGFPTRERERGDGPSTSFSPRNRGDEHKAKESKKVVSRIQSQGVMRHNEIGRGKRDKAPKENVVFDRVDGKLGKVNFIDHNKFEEYDEDDPKCEHMKKMNKMAKSVPNIRESFPVPIPPSNSSTTSTPSSSSSASSVVAPSSSVSVSSSSSVPLTPLSSSPAVSFSPSSSSATSSSLSQSLSKTASNMSGLIPLYKDGALKKGYLLIFRARKWQRLWCVLKENVLICYSSPNSIEELSEIDVTIGRVSPKCPMREKPNSFEITVKGKSTIFCTESEREKAEWVQILNCVAESYRSRLEASPSPRLKDASVAQTPPMIKTSSYLKSDVISLKNPHGQAKRDELAQTQNNLSQLIYALQTPTGNSPQEKVSCLLLDPSYAVVSGLYSIAKMKDEEEEFARALISFFVAFEESQKLMKHFVSLEIEQSKFGAVLFRSMSIATRLVSTYFFHVGHDYLIEFVQPAVTTIANYPDSLEVNPSKGGNGSSVEGRIDFLLGVAQEFLNFVFSNISKIPIGMRQILSHIQKETKKMHPEMEEIVIGAFIFLRFFCPSLVTPVKYEVVNEGVVNQGHQRALILISKLLQNLANQVEFDGSKEHYMIHFNDFIIKNLPGLKEFIKKILDTEEIEKSLREEEKREKKEDKEEEESKMSSLLWILRYINSQQAVIADLMSVKL